MSQVKIDLNDGSFPEPEITKEGEVIGYGGEILRRLGPDKYVPNDLPKLRPITLTDDEIESLQKPAALF